MGRQENVSIFEDTREFCKTNPIARNTIKLSNDHQEIFLENDPVMPVPKAEGELAKVVVSKKRSFEAAWDYAGYETCVLNFASATNPGGGVVWGSTAQEECLCRCSTLYANLIVRENWEQFYAPHRQQNNPLYISYSTPIKCETDQYGYVRYYDYDALLYGGSIVLFIRAVRRFQSYDIEPIAAEVDKKERYFIEKHPEECEWMSLSCLLEPELQDEFAKNRAMKRSLERSRCQTAGDK